MDAQIGVRGLRPADVPQLEQALGPSLASTYPDGDRWLRAALHPAGPGGTAAEQDITVATADTGQVLGLLVARRKPGGVKLSALWVHPAVRGQGVGTALLDRAVAAFGARPLYLTFDQSHAASMVPLLCAAGFQPTAALPGRYRPGATELVYTRPADPAAPVRALSLTRPWGQLVVNGAKNVENRSRRSTHRGLLVLHGAQSVTDLAATFCRDRRLASPPTPQDCAVGYLGVAHLVAVDCHHRDCADACSPWAMPESWHWRLAFATAFPDPIPGRGNVGLWTPPAEVLDAVTAAIAPTRS